MIQEKDLIEKWERSGFLVNKNYDEKVIFSKNLEKAADFITMNNFSDEFVQMVFPLIYSLTEKKKEFNIALAIIIFHERFNIDGHNLDSSVKEIKYLKEFVDAYIRVAIKSVDYLKFNIEKDKE